MTGIATSGARWLAAPAWLFATLMLPAVEAQEVIIDNADPGFTILQGADEWILATAASGRWGPDYYFAHTTATGAAFAEVEWRPNLPAAGTWEVAVWYPQGANRASDAPYTVDYAGGSAVVPVNQQTNGAEWFVLGAYPFHAGTGGRVRLSNQASPIVVIADAVRFTLVDDEPPPPEDVEFRGFWMDAWGAGLHNQQQVELMLGKVGSATDIGRIREVNANAVVVQVRRRADVCYPSGVGEPYFSGLSPSNYNALQAIIDAAHDTTGGKQRIDVHAWIVVFATATASTTPSPLYFQHNDPNDPENYWITRNQFGEEPGDRPLDPGHPGVQRYLTDVCLDLVENFDIDGLHYDYIRFTGTNQGYNPTSLARFKAKYGYVNDPSPSNEDFRQWRRDQVTAVVRRIYGHVMETRPEVNVSAAVVTWAPSPLSSTRAAFMSTRPYYEVYSDWDAWMQEGILDTLITMNYFRQTTHPQDYDRWMNFQKDRKFNRHTVVGPGIYLNSLSNAIFQLDKTRNISPAGNEAEGFCGYSYRVPYTSGTWDGFAPTFGAQVTPERAAVPELPWKTNPTYGHLIGTVTEAMEGNWVDGALVTLSGPENRTITCDGTGFYAFIDLAPGTYELFYDASGLPAGYAADVQVLAGQATRVDTVLGDSGPDVLAQPVNQAACPGQTATFSVLVQGEGTVNYQWQRNGVPLSNGGKISGVNTATLEIADVEEADLGNYSCLLTDDTGGSISDTAALSIKPTTHVLYHPQATSVALGESTALAIGATGSGTLSYQWYLDGNALANDGNLTGTSSPTLNIASALAEHAGSYHCVVTGDCGSALSNSAMLSVLFGPGDFNGDGDVDMEDFGRLQACLTGPNVPQHDPACAAARLDGDSDVDQDDVMIFLGCLSGAGIPAAPECAG